MKKEKWNLIIYGSNLVFKRRNDKYIQEHLENTKANFKALFAKALMTVKLKEMFIFLISHSSIDALPNNYYVFKYKKIRLIFHCEIKKTTFKVYIDDVTYHLAKKYKGYTSSKDMLEIIKKIRPKNYDPLFVASA